MFSSTKLRARVAAAAVILPTVCLIGVAAPAAHADVAETILHNFTGQPYDGAEPSEVVAGPDGTLYGTTFQGGVNNEGIIYKFSPAGQETIIHSFAGGSTDGSQPYQGVTLGPDGTIYGTTTYGGSAGEGIIYSVNPDGTNFQVLHSFQGGSDGGYPQGSALTFGTDGKLYGTTNGNDGTIFSIDTGGVEFNTEHIFSFSDGAGPDCILVQQPGSVTNTFYGFTEGGGANQNGVVFSYTPGVVLGTGTFTVLYSFSDTIDGGDPVFGRLQIDSAGNIYGVNDNGGTNNVGTIFRLSPDSNGDGGYTDTVLHNFNDGSVANDGTNPTGGLLLASDGNLYGVAHSGGLTNNGIVYSIATSGSNYSVLYTFDGNPNNDPDDGSYPYTAPIENGSGNLIGTTIDGGSSRANQAYGNGTIYELATQLLPITPPAAPATLSSLTISPSSVVGGPSPNDNYPIGTVTLTTPALVGGATVSLYSSNTSVVDVPATVTIPAGSTSATFPITTTRVTSTYNVSVAAIYNNSYQSANITVTPPPAIPTPSLRLVSVSPTSTEGGAATTTNRLYLAHPATYSATITLTSSNPAVASVPASVTVLQGSTSRAFTIKTSKVETPRTVTITASYNGNVKTATLTVNPAPIVLKSVVLSPASTEGGTAPTTANRVYLTGNATVASTITLTSSNPAVASVPKSVTVQQGYSSHVFTVTTSAVSSPTTVTITATSNGQSQTATLTVTL